MIKVKVTSLLGEEHRDDLEQMLFFHPQQGRFRRNIIDSVAKYGTPQLVEQQGGLRVHLPGLPDVQSLYAVSTDQPKPKLLGAVVFTRTAADELEILHIVGRHEHTFSGSHGTDSVAFPLVGELCRIARRVKGIHAVRLAYDRGKMIIRGL